jgi:hypothetical protein
MVLLPQMTGASFFREIFFDDAHLPHVSGECAPNTCTPAPSVV